MHRTKKTWCANTEGGLWPKVCARAHPLHRLSPSGLQHVQEMCKSVPMSFLHIAKDRVQVQTVMLMDFGQRFPQERCAPFPLQFWRPAISRRTGGLGFQDPLATKFVAATASVTFSAQERMYALFIGTERGSYHMSRRGRGIEVRNFSQFRNFPQFLRNCF